MFVLDSLLMAHGKAASVLFKELARKAHEEWLDDESVKQELQELHALLEAGRMSDRDFESRECRLLERLEQIARAKFRDKWGEEVSAVASESDLPPALPPAQDSEPDL
jgi:gas vesicle protein GvpG